MSQTLTETQLTDTLQRPLRDLRISVIDNCNLRCPYCMPVEEFGEGYQFLRRDELMSFDEIERLARAFARWGVKKFRITGGEPLLRKDLPDLIRRLSKLDDAPDLALTTNALLLPKFAGPLRDAGLARITVSLDSLDDEVFGQMNGRGVGAGPVLEGIDAALKVGLGPVKVNCVVQRGVNDHTVLDMVERFRSTPVILRFIEYMDVGTRNGWRLDEVVPSRELLERIGERWPLRPAEAGYRGEVAKRYVFDDGKGEIGFISSVTQTFCGDCTRARVSADGKFFTCLFGSEGFDLRGPLRDGATDDELAELVHSVWTRRADRYSEIRSAETNDSGTRVEMYRIGG